MTKNTGASQSKISQFLHSDSAGGILLIIAAVLAMVMANTPLERVYTLLVDTTFTISLGAAGLSKPLLLWINDGLMAVFFLLVGLELKRELLEGELSDLKNITLPAAGALGGMLVPAAIYVLFNKGDSDALSGWAIPAATDIAFALGILSLLGSRVPVSLKIFLTSVAIFDDVGAILIIAFFYTDSISTMALSISAVCLSALFYCNFKDVSSIRIYLFIGTILWVALLKSGIHATLAGVLVALFIPNKDYASRVDYTNKSPLKLLEHELHAPVAFVILPVFAFANSGIDLRGMSIESITHSVPVGIALGLFIGKQLGVFSFCWLALKLGLTTLPKGMSLTSMYGVALLCGIGFTMSLFIGSLAFEETGVNLLFDERLGIVVGSVLSAVLGYIVLSKSLPALSSNGAPDEK